MFSENGKISGRQMNRLLILDLFAVSCMVLPRLLPDICGRQGFFAVAAGAGAAILSALLYTKTARCYTDNFFAFARRQTAAVPAVIFYIIFYDQIFIISRLCSENVFGNYQPDIFDGNA